MNTLRQNGISRIWHTAPLHYLGFIARSRALKSKARLRSEGFEEWHFRSTTHATDERLGFSNVVHLFNRRGPRILLQKLQWGLPHVEISVPAHTLEGDAHLLCWYNVARNRGTFIEDPSRGYIQSPFRLPVALTVGEKHSLLRSTTSARHVEVLVTDALQLPDETEVTVFGEWDMGVTREVLRGLGLPWEVAHRTHIAYGPSLSRRLEVEEFLHRSISDAGWRGDGMEYDRRRL